ncbi:MAG: hypothetical protein FJ272_12835, partial [Planctomycetes bacterium]|nr:hypothetical protein [Planctomycetota bacterium]
MRPNPSSRHHGQSSSNSHSDSQSSALTAECEFEFDSEHDSPAPVDCPAGHASLLPLCLALSLLCAPCVAAPDDIRLTETPTELRFANGVIELAFDRATGDWRGLTDKASGLNALTAASTNLSVDGKPLLQPDRFPTYRSHRSEAEGEAKRLSITSALGDWEITAHYTLWPGQDLVRCDAEFVYRGPQPDKPAVARNMQFILSGVRLGDPSENTYTLLAAYPPETRLFADLQPGRRVSEPWSGSCARSVAVHNSRRQLTLVTLFLSETEAAGAFVEEGKDSISVTQSLWLTDYAKPGRRIAGGSQFVRLIRGPWDYALRNTQSIYRFVPLDAPSDAPPNADKAVIYSAHPGGTIDSGFRDVGGFQNFSKMIPYLAGLGVDTLWLLPFWQGPVYAPNDYYKLDARLGTPEDLSALTALAHKHGMRVLGDLIPHGPRDESGLHNEHPDWICRDPDGKMIYWWGCLYCDYAHPGWQRYMADHAAYWVKTCGLDGYRVDVAGGGPPNWQPHGDNRPSHSGLAGGLKLMAEARRACKQHNPNAVILPEASGPAFFRTGDFVYDMMFGHFILPHALRESPADFVRHVSQWLEYQQYYYPPHARLMRFLENHDTVRARLRYGVGLHRALLALCAFSKGVPFLYHEQEVGDGPFLRSLYRVRERYPQLTEGEASYTAVQCSTPGVLTILRQQGDRRAVVAINFNPYEVTTDFRLPFDLPQGWRLWNVLRGEELEEGFLPLPAGRLPAYGLTVLIPKEAQDDMWSTLYMSV